MYGILTLIQQLPFKYFKISTNDEIEWWSLKPTDDIIGLSKAWVSEKLLIYSVRIIFRKLFVVLWIDRWSDTHSPEIRVRIIHPIVFS